jgi:uncharacterized protein YdeI (YjbR/CyaY-like superfamily)
MPENIRNGLPILWFENRSAFESWINAHASEERGIWIKFAKKNSGSVSIDYDQALEIALCYGWIDSQVAAFDGNYYLQKFSPRRARSKWSRMNREKAEALIASGRMQAAGYRQVELASQDGRWEAAYDPQSTITIPSDFQEALDHNPQAHQFFLTLDSHNRYAILHRLQVTKKPPARSAKIQNYIEMLAKHEKIYP